MPGLQRKPPHCRKCSIALYQPIYGSPMSDCRDHQIIPNPFLRDEACLCRRKYFAHLINVINFHADAYVGRCPKRLLISFRPPDGGRMRG